MRKTTLLTWVFGGVMLLVLLAVWALGEREKTELEAENWDYKPHLTLGETTYWLSTGGTASELPEGYVEVAQITEVVSGLAEKTGQANGHAVGTPVYHCLEQPGWVYVPGGRNDSWVRYTVIELQKDFLRYGGRLYLRALDIPYEMEVDAAFSVKRLEPVEAALTPAPAETIPLENGSITRGFGAKARLLRDPEHPELLVVGDGGEQEDYTAYVDMEHLGLDYSAWEWR